jgi:hypothetical protein
MMQTTTEMRVPQFESKLQVLRVRPTYIAAFKKCRFLYLERNHLRSKQNFLRYLSSITEKWPNGTFYLKLSNGKVFARINIKDGKVQEILKCSPATGRMYPIWQFFRANGTIKN